jgi:hypothetical protein
MKPVSLIIGTLALAALATGASAQDATYSIRLMTPDTALKAAQAAHASVAA